MAFGTHSLRAMARLRLATLRSRARQAVGDASGTTAIEFAMVAPLVIAIILASLQLGVIYLAQAELENAGEQAARLVYTSQAPGGQSAFQTSVCGYLPALFTCSGVMIDLQAQAVSANDSDALTMTPPTLTYNSGGQVTNTWNYNPGAPGQLVILRLMYQWPVYAGPLGLFFGDLSNGMLLLSSTQVFQNEH